MPAFGGAARQPVLVVMGISGSGKSTVAALLATATGWDFQEGDDLHPAENVAKMAAGIPLDDDDRVPWLAAVAAWIRQHREAGRPGIITCSALKRVYRDKLRGENVVFVHLTGSTDTVGRRLDARVDHYMPASLLDSQVASLEPLGADENAIEVDLTRPPGEIAAEVIDGLGLTAVVTQPRNL